MKIEEAFGKYQDQMVRAMASFSRDEEAAKDGVSAAFAKATINRQMLESMHEGAMKAWIYSAARNSVIDIKRREIRFSRRSVKTDVYEFADPRSDDPLGRILTETLLNALPESLRLPVELKYFKRMNASEIGEMMSLPPATVRTRLRTAIRQMRENSGRKA